MPSGGDAIIRIEHKYFPMYIQNHIQNSIFLDSMSCAINLNILSCMRKYYIRVEPPMTMISIPQIILVFRK